MKKQFIAVSMLLLVSIFIAACGWKPEVTAKPITAPWSEMNLPVKENAVVWKSEPNEFRAVHKEDKPTVMKKYTEALKAQGWELSDFEQSDTEYTAQMKKGAEEFSLRFYDFDNTGVVIEKK